MPNKYLSRNNNNTKAYLNIRIPTIDRNTRHIIIISSISNISSHLRHILRKSTNNTNSISLSFNWNTIMTSLLAWKA